jgi:4'-phosphopantetheinyl transferase
MLDIGLSDVHLWFRKTEGLTDEDVTGAERSLSTEERARRDRFHFAADRRDFTIAHDLLRRTLSSYANVSPADWCFTTNEYGKPSIDSEDRHLAAISFSLTHTKGCVACGVTLGETLGVDIERADRSLAVMEIANQYFSQKEAAWLRHCSAETRRVRFAELWTLKEAFLKATGVGLSGSLATVSFRFEEPGRLLFDPPCTSDRSVWRFALVDLGSMLRLGVAVRNNNQPHFTVREFSSGAPRLGPTGSSE